MSESAAAGVVNSSARLAARFGGVSILSVLQFSRNDLIDLVNVADYMATVIQTKQNKPIFNSTGSNNEDNNHHAGISVNVGELVKGRVLSLLFYESSTRTSSSFQSAWARMGGQCVSISDAGNSSSASKGESLSDSLACLSSYSDAIVIRHPQAGALAQTAAARTRTGYSLVPIINAGDGTGEHPTQALLDLFTIVQELKPLEPGCSHRPENSNAHFNPISSSSSSSVSGSISGSASIWNFGFPPHLHITMVGDLKNGRTVHSLAKLLTTIYGQQAGPGGAPAAADEPRLTLHYVSPASLCMPSEIVDLVSAAGIHQSVHRELDDSILAVTDILYVTRVQRERFADLKEYEAVSDCYCITPLVLAKCKKTMRLLHPLPRLGEISVECDIDERSAYFRQMKYGMFMRMALLAAVVRAQLN